MIQASMTYS